MRLHEGDTVLDVGANCGALTLVAARQVGKGQVYALGYQLSNPEPPYFPIPLDGPYPANSVAIHPQKPHIP
jgi:23S rRNA U2552 (ribose-2'-O)-methylase RlmE/FtsJ